MLAASATAGTLVGFGIVRGAPVHVLNTIAHTIFGARALTAREFDLPVTVTGIAVHYLTLIIYGVVFAILFGRLRGRQLMLSAAAVTGIVAVFDLLILPPLLRPGFESVLGTGELATIFLELAVALAVGTRIFAPRSVVA
ncbi:MAG TPA: hypothetical protein VJ596_06670 [Gemmatimonadaceae bacterium]|nr:hypothetical protein [Gemmatimonadaceae bacterium]